MPHDAPAAAASLLDWEHYFDGDAPSVLSVCSGVGGKDLGFHRAGFRTVGLCEWDEWRRQVLARHWPGVPIHGDLEALAAWAQDDPDAVREWLGGQPDVLIGGTPCQDLSHAGKRAGIDGGRSGLFWDFIRLRNALDVEWTVWENVAGALTSNAGLDFMAVVGAFVGAAVPVPAAGVGGAGVAAGPWGGCVWRLLNAQHFGVPQRRRRVFVVGRLGGPCPPEVLIEPHGGGGNPEEGGAPGADPAWAADARAGAARGTRLARGGRGGGRGGAGGADPGLGQRVAGTLGGGHPSERGYRNDLDSSGAYVDTANALTGKGSAGGAGIDDNGAKAGLVVAPAVTTSPGFAAGCGHSGGDAASLAVGAALTGDGARADDEPAPRDGAGAVDGGAGGGAHGHDAPAAERPPGGGLRRDGADDRVPRPREDGRAEGRRAGADADEVGQPGGQHRPDAAAADADGVREADGVAGPLDGAAAVPEGEEGRRVSAVSQNQRGELREAEVQPSLGGGGGKPGQGYPLALIEHDGATHALTAEGFDASEDGTGRGTPIVATGPEDEEAQGVALRGRDGGATAEVSDQAPALRGSSGGGSRAHVLTQAPTLRGSVGNGGGAQKDDALAFDLLSNGGADEELAPAMRGGGGNTMPHVLTDPETGAAVPEGAATAWDPPPDGRRYAACGDGVAGPHGQWVGMRLLAVIRGLDPDEVASCAVRGHPLVGGSSCVCGANHP